jgi:hypothetical protein
MASFQTMGMACAGATEPNDTSTTPSAPDDMTFVHSCNNFEERIKSVYLIQRLHRSYADTANINDWA